MSFAKHLFRLCVTIFLLKGSKKDFHFYPPALRLFIFFQLLFKQRFRQTRAWAKHLIFIFYEPIAARLFRSSQLVCKLVFNKDIHLHLKSFETLRLTLRIFGFLILSCFFVLFNIPIYLPTIYIFRQWLKSNFCPSFINIVRVFQR